MVSNGTLVKIMTNHDTWNACQDHAKILARLARNVPWIVARIPWLRTLGTSFDTDPISMKSVEIDVLCEFVRSFI